MVHRDSLGLTDRLEAGDAQVIRAGRGMLHAEKPDGGRHGLQFWLSLAPDRKLADPHYESMRADRLPLIERDGARIVVVAGQVDDVQGPMTLAGRGVFARLEQARRDFMAGRMGRLDGVPF